MSDRIAISDEANAALQEWMDARKNWSDCGCEERFRDAENTLSWMTQDKKHFRDMNDFDLKDFNALEDAYAMAYNDGHRDGRNRAGYSPGVVKVDRETFREAYKMRAESFEAITDEWLVNLKRSNPLSRHYIPSKSSEDWDEDGNPEYDYDPREGDPYCEACMWYKEPEDLHFFHFEEGTPYAVGYLGYPVEQAWCTDCVLNHPEFAPLVDKMDPNLDEDEAAEKIAIIVSGEKFEAQRQPPWSAANPMPNRIMECGECDAKGFIQGRECSKCDGAGYWKIMSPKCAICGDWIAGTDGAECDECDKWYCDAHYDSDNNSCVVCGDPMTDSESMLKHSEDPSSDWDPTGEERRLMGEKCEDERSFLISILSDRQLDEFLQFEEDSYSAEDEFESPVSCKICGKTFASFRGLNGHMNAHLPSHRKRAEIKLGKDSCCCGATKTNPCQCMVEGLTCSSTCPCSCGQKNAESDSEVCWKCIHSSTPHPSGSARECYICNTHKPATAFTREDAREVMEQYSSGYNHYCDACDIDMESWEDLKAGGHDLELLGPDAPRYGRWYGRRAYKCKICEETYDSSHFWNRDSKGWGFSPCSGTLIPDHGQCPECKAQIDHLMESMHYSCPECGKELEQSDSHWEEIPWDHFGKTLDSRYQAESDSDWNCVICGDKSTGYGHNPDPVALKGRCCDTCNSTIVIPNRLMHTHLWHKKKADYTVDVGGPYGARYTGTIKEVKEAEEDCPCPVCGTTTEVIREWYNDDTAYVDLVVCDNCYWMEELGENDEEYDAYMEQMLALLDEEEPDPVPNVVVDTSWDWSDGVGPPSSQQTLDITYDAEDNKSIMGHDLKKGYNVHGIDHDLDEWGCTICGYGSFYPFYFEDPDKHMWPCPGREPTAEDWYDSKRVVGCPVCKSSNVSITWAGFGYIKDTDNIKVYSKEDSIEIPMADHEFEDQPKMEYYCDDCSHSSYHRGSETDFIIPKDVGLLEAEGKYLGHDFKKEGLHSPYFICKICEERVSGYEFEEKGYIEQCPGPKPTGTCPHCQDEVTSINEIKVFTCPSCGEVVGENDGYWEQYPADDEYVGSFLEAEGDEKIYKIESEIHDISNWGDGWAVDYDVSHSSWKSKEGARKALQEAAEDESEYWFHLIEENWGEELEFSFTDRGDDEFILTIVGPQGPIDLDDFQTQYTMTTTKEDYNYDGQSYRMWVREAYPYEYPELLDAEGDEELTDEEKQEVWNVFQEEAASLEDPDLEQIKNLADKYLTDVIDDETPEFFVDPGLEDYYQYILTDPTYPEGGEPEDEEAAAMFEELKQVRYWATILTDRHVEEADTAAKAMIAAGLMGGDKKLFEQGMLGLETNNQVQRERELLAQWLAEGGVHEN